MRAEMTLPDDFPTDTLQIYFWKPNKTSLLIDDFELIWRRHNSEIHELGNP